MSIARESKKSEFKPAETQLTDWYWCALSNGYFNTAKILAEMGATPLKPVFRDFAQLMMQSAITLPPHEFDLIKWREKLKTFTTAQHPYEKNPLLSKDALKQLSADSKESAVEFMMQETQYSTGIRDKDKSRLINITNYFCLEDKTFLSQLRDQKDDPWAQFMSHPLYKKAFAAYIATGGTPWSGTPSWNLTETAAGNAFLHCLKEAISNHDILSINEFIKLINETDFLYLDTTNVLFHPGWLLNHCYQFAFSENNFVMADYVFHQCTDKLKMASFYDKLVVSLDHKLFAGDHLGDRLPIKIAEISRILALGFDLAQLTKEINTKLTIQFPSIAGAIAAYQAYLQENPNDYSFHYFEDYRRRNTMPKEFDVESFKKKLNDIHNILPDLFETSLDRFNQEKTLFFNPRKNLLSQMRIVPEGPESIVMDYVGCVPDSLMKEKKEEKTPEIRSEVFINPSELRKQLSQLTLPVNPIGKLFSTTYFQKSHLVNLLLQKAKSQDDIFILKLGLALLKEELFAKQILIKLIPLALYEASKLLKSDFFAILRNELIQKIEATLVDLRVPKKDLARATIENLIKPSGGSEYKIPQILT